MTEQVIYAKDLGHVIEVTIEGWGATDAMRRAERATGGNAKAFRAHLVQSSPDPEDWPSTFEVLVRIEEES